LEWAAAPDLAVDAPAQIPVVASDSACTACGACVDACPSRCLYLASEGESVPGPDGAAPTFLEIDPARCIGCGRCVDACPEGVLSLSPVHRASFAPIGRSSRRVALGRLVAGPV
jgi:ferredoxin